MSYSNDELVNLERIDTLHTSLMNQLNTIPSTDSSLEQIIQRIPFIFRFLHKNLQSQKIFSNECNFLSSSIQKIIATFSQYIHNRHEYENELFFLKEKITQIIGEIRYAQYYLQEYWTIIYSLEHEIERLQILLRNPQVLQLNLRKFQTFQETKKIHLDRLMKENEKLKLLVKKQKDSIQLLQRQIENDLDELRTLRPILDKAKSEENDINKHWLQIEKQNLQLETIFEATKTMENEYNDRIKRTQIQYDLVQKNLNELKNTYNETNQNLLLIRTAETNITQEIENIKNQNKTEQIQSMITRDKIRNLQHQTHQFEQRKRYMHTTLKFEENMNFKLERKRIACKNKGLQLDNRIHYLDEQFHDLVKRNEKNEHVIMINKIHLQHQQNKIIKMKVALQKTIHLNNNFQKILQENRSIQIDEKEKLRSMKQISFQKRKQLIKNTRQLHLLSINQYKLIDKTVRNSTEIIRLKNIFYHLNNNENYCQLMVRKKKTEMMNREKQRTSLNRNLREHSDKMDFFNKKNQFIQNELRSKIDYHRSINHNLLKQKYDLIIISNRKQHIVYLFKQKLHILNSLHARYNQLELLSNNEWNRIIRRNQENEQLKLNISHLKQHIMNSISRNKRHINEHSLLNEKVRLYTQYTSIYDRQQQQCSLHIHQLSNCIWNLQRENHQLIAKLKTIQTKAITTTKYHDDKLLKYKTMNLIASRRSLIIRDSLIRTQIDKTSENYLIHVKRYLKIIHECTQWRERLLWVNQLYSTKLKQVYEQTISLSTNDDLILRHKLNSQLRQYKAKQAEYRIDRIYKSS